MKNRFEKNHKSISSVRNEIRILEDWLDIHPFPKYIHKAHFAICRNENLH